MNVRTILSVAAIASALAFPGLAGAQEEHMIGGKPVPADQIAAVEARCQELRSLATEAPAPANDAATPAPASDAAAMDSDPDAATEVWSGDIFSIANLTIDHCDEGKFAMPAK
jgi:hypothetical protein